jgi:hypothetical protein
MKLLIILPSRLSSHFFSPRFKSSQHPVLETPVCNPLSMRATEFHNHTKSKGNCNVEYINGYIIDSRRKHC